jgi:hypothetical protein
LTPAKPKVIKRNAEKPAAKPSKVAKQRAQPTKSKPKTLPASPPTFAARQLQASHNKQSAALLFTPHRHLGSHVHFSHEQPSPTPAARLGTQNLAPHSDFSDCESDVEKELEEGLQRLNFGTNSDPGSHSDSQSASGSQSRSHSQSHSHAPRAGPHSKASKPVVKPKGGAQDVWSFFTKVKGRHECVLCQ